MQALKKIEPDWELKKAIETAGVKISEIAEALNLPRSSLSLLIHGKYKNEKLRERIMEYLAERAERPENVGRYFQTEGQKRILAVLEATLEDREFSLIVGPSGVGKTYTVQEFISKRKGNIVYFKITKLMSAGEVLRQLCMAVGTPSYGSNGTKMQRLKIKAEEFDMIIVDEADLLVDREKPKSFLKKIEIFRELAEVTAVVLVGLPELDEAIYENARSYVYSRIGYYARVLEPTPEELWEFARLRGITSKEVISGAIGRGYFRFIEKVAKRAGKIGEKFAVALMYYGKR